MRIAGLYPQAIELDPKLDPDPEEPLGLEYILAIGRDAGHEAQLYVPLENDHRESLEQLVAWKPDVLCLSLFTKHVPIGLWIAGEVKRRLPSVVVVAGGPHPSADPTFIENPPIDFCVIGEGEETFRELLQVLEKGGGFSKIAGLQFRDDRGILITTLPRARIQKLDNLPFPIRDPRFYDQPGHGLCYPAASKVRYAPIVYSRGCPLTCSFCSSPKLWGRKVTFRSPANTIGEIFYLTEAFSVNYLFFEDLIFTVNRRKVLDLCSAMIKERCRVHWACETSIRMVDEELLAAMHEAGCTKIAYGIESINIESVRQIGKNQDIDIVRRNLSLTAKQGILTWAFYVVGFPWESTEDITAAMELLPDLDIHQLRVTIATPYPGSPWCREIHPDDLNPDLGMYDTNRLVYRHPRLTSEAAKDLQVETFRRFYESHAYSRRVREMCRAFPYLRESFEEFRGYIEQSILEDEMTGAGSSTRTESFRQ